MTITQLENPKTSQYKEVKRFVLSNQFAWYHNHAVIVGNDDKIIVENGIEYHNVPFFSHGIIGRPLPGQRYPTIRDEYVSEFQKMFDEIFSYNKLELNCFYRINVNLVPPTKDQITVPFHTDHPWPHKNMLIYLTNAGGETICEGGSFNPSEDDIIIFSGYPERHCYAPSTEKNRIVIVATYI